MTAPITEERLAAIEEWATDHATRCHECDAVARVVIPGTSRALCAACAPDVPGAVLPLVSSYADSLDLVAEVRRLTAALATARREGAELMRARAAKQAEKRRSETGDDIADEIRALPLDAPGGAT